MTTEKSVRVSDEELELIRVRALGRATIRLPAQLVADLTKELTHLRAVRDAAVEWRQTNEAWEVGEIEGEAVEIAQYRLFALLAAQEEGEHE